MEFSIIWHELNGLYGDSNETMYALLFIRSFKSMNSRAHWVISVVRYLLLSGYWRTFQFQPQTFERNASTSERIFLLFFPLQPAENSGPSDVSAVKACFVPLFDSNTKPVRSSLRIVACCNTTKLITIQPLFFCEQCLANLRKLLVLQYLKVFRLFLNHWTRAKKDGGFFHCRAEKNLCCNAFK